MGQNACEGSIMESSEQLQKLCKRVKFIIISFKKKKAKPREFA